MGLSGVQTACFVLMPGGTEFVKNEAVKNDDVELVNKIDSIIDTRNHLYAGVAIIALSMMTPDTACSFVPLLGTGIVAFAAKVLYDEASSLQHVVKSRMYVTNLF